jgi:hypothetical protein
MQYWSVMNLIPLLSRSKLVADPAEKNRILSDMVARGAKVKLAYYTVQYSVLNFRQDYLAFHKIDNLSVYRKSELIL